MPNRLNPLHDVIQAMQTSIKCVVRGIHSVCMSLQSHIALTAEALFLQRQLALYTDQNEISQRDLNATRFTLVWLSHWFELGTGSHHRALADLQTLAASRLAVGVKDTRQIGTSSDSTGVTGTHSAYGPRKHDLGSTTDCQ